MVKEKYTRMPLGLFKKLWTTYYKYPGSGFYFRGCWKVGGWRLRRWSWGERLIEDKQASPFLTRRSRTFSLPSLLLQGPLLLWKDHSCETASGTAAAATGGVSAASWAPHLLLRMGLNCFWKVLRGQSTEGSQLLLEEKQLPLEGMGQLLLDRSSGYWKESSCYWKGEATASNTGLGISDGT